MSLILAFLAAALQSSSTPPPSSRAPAEHLTSTVQLVRAKDVQPVAFEYSDNTIVIEAEVGGQQGWMLIDTGSPHTIIDTGLAKELGRTIVPMKGDMLAVGGHLVQRQRVDDVALVIPHHFSIRMPMLAVDLSSVSRSAHRRIEGIIGNDIISNMLLWVMKPQGELILLPGGNVKFTCKGPCTDTTTPRPISIDKVADHEEVVAAVGDRTLRLKIDTGDAGGIGLRPEAWERVKPADAQVFTRMSIGASGVVDKVQSSRLPEVSIGPTKVEDVRVDVLKLGPSDGDGLIGMGVLSRYSFALDTKKGQLWLIPAPADPSKLPPPVLSKPAERSSAASHL